ncbi:MAG TPA: DUF4097 domain-containing protein [Clostridiaceae bacterium]|nr:DUF4097 domain-containing protein [Clostridiaceae bacterium]
MYPNYNRNRGIIHIVKAVAFLLIAMIVYFAVGHSTPFVIFKARDQMVYETFAKFKPAEVDSIYFDTDSESLLVEGREDAEFYELQIGSPAGEKWLDLDKSMNLLSGGCIEITSSVTNLLHRNRSKFNIGLPFLSYKLIVPIDDAPIDIKFVGKSSDLEVNNCNCRTVEANAASGDIELEGITADHIALRTISGDIELTGVVAEKSELKTTSGDCDLVGVSGEHLRVQTTSGDAELTEIAIPSIVAETSSGDIDSHMAMLPDHLDISTSSGEIELEFTIKSAHRPSQPETEIFLFASAGSGDVRIKNSPNWLRADVKKLFSKSDQIPSEPDWQVQSSSGDINIEFTQESNLD